MQFADPSLSHPSRCSRARWPTKCQKQGWASRPEFRVLSLGLPGDTRLLGKTVQTEIFQQRGGAVKALTLRARPFCNRQVGELRECANRGRNTWFPAPSSPSSLTCGPQPSAAPTRCGSLGTQERRKWAFLATVSTPKSTTGTNPPPTAIEISTRAAQVYPAPGALPARFQLQWGPPRAQLLPPPTRSRPEPRPAPPGIASPLARSRRIAHFHQGLPVSPVPTPGSRRGSRTSLLPPGQTRGQYIHPTETIQAVYDLGIKRGLQKGKMS